MRGKVTMLVALLAACAPAVAQSPTAPATPQQPPAAVQAPATPATPAAPSAPSRFPIAIYGDGAVTCGTWMSEAKDSPAHLQHIQWIAGFASGYAAFITDVVGGGGSTNDTVAWIDNRGCAFDPNVTLAQAVISLIDYERSMTHYSRLWPMPTVPPLQYFQ